jgi:hypothetical protein
MEAPRKAQSASAINREESEFHGIHLSTEEVQRKLRAQGNHADKRRKIRQALRRRMKGVCSLSSS